MKTKYYGFDKRVKRASTFLNELGGQKKQVRFRKPLMTTIK